MRAAHLVVDVDIHVDAAHVDLCIRATVVSCCGGRSGGLRYCGLRLAVMDDINVVGNDIILLDRNLREEIEFPLVRIVLVVFDFVGDVAKLGIGVLEWQVIFGNFLDVFVFENDFGVVIRLVQIFDAQVGLRNVVHFFAVEDEEEFIAAFGENRQVTDVAVLGETDQIHKKQANAKRNFFHIHFFSL